MEIGRFVAELKRRNVYKVAVAYAVIGWLLLQVTTQIFPFLEIPNWAIRLVIVLVAIGFPIALILAWALETTPEGIRRIEAAEAAGQHSHSGAWIYIVLVGVALSLGLFFLGRYTVHTPRPSEAATVPQKSIAVLPFDNLSDDKANAYFAEGVQDEILTRLASVADLKVISRTSTQHFKSAPDNLREIAKQLYDFDFEQSVKEFERAIQLNPDYATAHHWYANGPLVVLGQFDRAIAEGKRAVELDPLSLIINANLGQDYFYARRYDEAIDQLRKTIEMDPRFYAAHWDLGPVWQSKGQLNEAIAEYRKAVELNDDPYVLALLGQAYARAGQRDEAQRILARLNEEATSRYVSAYAFALMFLALGDKDRAVDELERACRERAGSDIAYIKIDPMLDDLRGNPRFEALTEKVVPARLFQKAVTQR
jgi:tetratricopeptide (TPR) repeat protein